MNLSCTSPTIHPTARTVAHEFARATGLTIRLAEAHIPVNESIQSVGELLGFDPLYLACERRLVAVVAPQSAQAASRAPSCCDTTEFNHEGHAEEEDRDRRLRA